MSETNEERVSEFLSPDAPSDPRSLSREIWYFLKQNKHNLLYYLPSELSTKYVNTAQNKQSFYQLS